jgi:DNA uptake protein ComE-like DNA-binding protein
LLKNLTIHNNINEKNGKTLFVFDPNTIIPEMLDSLDLPENIKRNLINYRSAGGQFSNQSQLRKIYGMNDSIYAVLEKYIIIPEKSDSFDLDKVDPRKSIKVVFDPNNVDFNQLIDLGFNSYQANNLIKYRSKVGIFRSKVDLLKIYGIDTAFYKSIENYIQINIMEESTPPDNIHVLFHIELNNADSIELVQLNGVGSVFATRILKYRDLLGGFYSTSQLLEVYKFPVETFQKIENSVSVDTMLIKKIRVNFAEFPDLIRHPYLNKKQVEAVINFRNRNGSFQDIMQLKSNGLIDSETFQKIRPYLTCR